MTKSTKTKAVNRTFLLVKSGVNITDARQTVATELGLKAGSTIWHWQSQLKMKTPTVTNKIVTRTSNVAVMHNIADDPSIPESKAQLKRVLTAHVEGTGEYSTKQVLATCQLGGSILAFSKHELEVAKFINKNVNKPSKNESHVL